MNNEFDIHEASIIKANIFTKDFKKTIRAINEVVIKNIESRTVHLDLSVNDIEKEVKPLLSKIMAEQSKRENSKKQ